MEPQKYQPRLIDKFYLPAILKGLIVTVKHMLRPWQHSTIEYPDEKWKPYVGYRGAHRLNKDENGRIKCVACEMCATACPAHCITIVPAEAPWDDRERMPEIFEIDMLRCIYCGFCEDACPVEAIELTEVYDFADYSRQALIWDKDKLLDMFDQTKDNTHYPGKPGDFTRQ